MPARFFTLGLGLFLFCLAACSSPAPAPSAVPATAFPPHSATLVLPTALPPTGSPATATALPLPTLAAPNATEIGAGLDRYFGVLETSGRFSGVVFVARTGEILYDKGFGKTKIAPQKPITPETKFHIASVTKQITSAAILHLQAMGKLKVHDPICNYLEACPEGWQDIQFHHLMSNTSGLKDFFDFDIKKPHTLTEIVAIMQKEPMRAASGGPYFHNTFGFILLAHLIERISGETYEHYLEETFLKPLGMKHTGSDIAASELAGFDDGTDYSNVTGGANLYSTVGDMYLWTQALDKWQRDPDSEYQPMFHPQTKTVDGADYGYALIMGDSFGQHYVGHPGNGFGNNALVGRYLDSGTTVILFSNSGFTFTPDDEYVKTILGAK